MTRFSVGDRIIVRYGTHQGQKGRVIKTQQADVYEVKIADGFILFFSAKGLEKDDVENAAGVNAQRLPAYGGLHRPRNTIA